MGRNQNNNNNKIIVLISRVFRQTTGSSVEVENRSRRSALLRRRDCSCAAGRHCVTLCGSNPFLRSLNVPLTSRWGPLRSASGEEFQNNGSWLAKKPWKPGWSFTEAFCASHALNVNEPKTYSSPNDVALETWTGTSFVVIFGEARFTFRMTGKTLLVLCFFKVYLWMYCVLSQLQTAIVKICIHIYLLCST